jgi:hypothetical protein
MSLQIKDLLQLLSDLIKCDRKSIDLGFNLRAANNNVQENI